MIVIINNERFVYDVYWNALDANRAGPMSFLRTHLAAPSALLSTAQEDLIAGVDITSILSSGQRSYSGNQILQQHSSRPYSYSWYLGKQSNGTCAS